MFRFVKSWVPVASATEAPESEQFKTAHLEQYTTDEARVAVGIDFWLCQ